jgi:hypothetical protein
MDDLGILECYPYRFIVIIASGHFYRSGRDRDSSYRSKAWGNLVLMLRHCLCHSFIGHS